MHYTQQKLSSSNNIIKKVKEKLIPRIMFFSQYISNFLRVRKRLFQL